MAPSRPVIQGFAAVLLTLLLLASCASTSTSLKNEWEEPGYSGGPFKRIIVFGLGADGALSRTFEDIFTMELKQRGVDAVPGYTVVPDGEQATRENIEKAAKAAGADGFLVARLVKTDKETQYGAGYMPTMAADMGPVPAIGMYNSFYGYYSASVTYSPPTAYRYEMVTVETNLWDVRTEKLVWSATTQTFAPGSVAREAPGFAKVIIASLAKRGLLPAQP
jgi:hypothetical protein